MLKQGQLCEIRHTDSIFDGHLCRVGTPDKEIRQFAAEADLPGRVFITMITGDFDCGWVDKNCLVPKVEAGPGLDLEAPCSL